MGGGAYASRRKKTWHSENCVFRGPKSHPLPPPPPVLPCDGAGPKKGRGRTGLSRSRHCCAWNIRPPIKEKPAQAPVPVIGLAHRPRTCLSAGERGMGVPPSRGSKLPHTATYAPRGISRESGSRAPSSNDGWREFRARLRNPRGPTRRVVGIGTALGPSSTMWCWRGAAGRREVAGLGCASWRADQLDTRYLSPPVKRMVSGQAAWSRRSRRHTFIPR